MRILVVEDEKKVAKALKEGLEAEHFEVAIATNGEEGFSTREAPLVPRAIASHLTGIVGLSDLNRLRPHHTTPVRM